MPTSLATHKANRAAAGAAYATAAAAYVAAWIELQAYDECVANAAIGGGPQLGFGAQPFVVGHGEFLREEQKTTNNDITARARARANQLIAS